MSIYLSMSVIKPDFIGDQASAMKISYIYPYTKGTPTPRGQYCTVYSVHPKLPALLPLAWPYILSYQPSQSGPVYFWPQT